MLRKWLTYLLKLKKAKTNLQQLKEAGSDFPEIDLDVDTSKLDANGLDARIAELTKARDESETKFGVDSAEVENLNTLLEEAIERKKLLENPSSVSVETSNLDEAIAKATLAADAIREATGGKVDIDVNAKTDSSIYNEIEKTKNILILYITLMVQLTVMLLNWNLHSKFFLL